MKKFGKFTLAAMAVALVAPALAGAMPVAGVPGYAARAERVASYVSPQDLKDFDSGNSRAGGVVGAAPPTAQQLEGSAGRATT